ncbi:MAG: hypothetical protein HRT44_04260, partial [Bdellovibrionales bacterium]|nr:hypothetical protein [Bdellovibrionales bacterium]NQZ18457.1 hypothetical protein [Bdellovibrionales bacterium]
MKIFIQQTVLSIMALMLFALTAKASDCLPQEMSINDSQIIDETESMNMTYYHVKAQFGESCESPYSNRNLIILVATLEPGDIEANIEEERYGNLVEEKKWNIRVNTSYFDDEAKPTMLLMDRGEDLGAIKSNRGGVFYCTQGRCHLKKSSSYNVNPNHDVVVQSVPRMINAGKYTSGLHSPQIVDERIGL